MPRLASPKGQLGSFAAATGHPIATTTALETLDSGGNAADALVAASFALCALMPDACGLGGDAFALISSSTDTVAYNGSGRVPQVWSGELPTSGAGLETTPGVVDALYSIHQAHGSLVWSDLLQPAVHLAEDGIPVSLELLASLDRRRELLDQHAKSWTILQQRNEGTDTFRQPELARTLRDVADGGKSAFYFGDIATSLLHAAKASGSKLSQLDLESHETLAGEPIRVVLGDLLIEAQPPVSQASLVPFALSAIANMGASEPTRTHLLIEALEEGFQWRPTFSSEGAAGWLPWDWRPPNAKAKRKGGAHGTSHTTSVVISDAEGNVATALLSVFHEFGSGFFVPELGFFLNDRMASLSDSRTPLTKGRPVHTLSPVFVRSPEMCFGIATPGADAQVQVLSQVLDGLVHEGLSWEEALARGRWRLQEKALVVESDIDPTLRDYLQKQDHKILTVPPKDRSMGAVTAAGRVNHGGSTRLHSSFAISDGRRNNSSGTI